MLDLYTVHWNEEKITPFMINYWKLLPIRKIFILDNESTDNSLNLILSDKDIKNKVEIIKFKSDGFNDIIHMNIKNNIWKEHSKGKVDFVHISDFDEIIYHPNIINELKFMKENNKDILFSTQLDIICQKFPEYSDLLLHEYPQCKFVLNTGDQKRIIFNPNTIQEMNYNPGAHLCNPMKHDKTTVNYHFCKCIQFHCKLLSLEYLVKRSEDLKNRLSEINKKFGFRVSL